MANQTDPDYSVEKSEVLVMLADIQ
jgi:hypothetical protein